MPSDVKIKTEGLDAVVAEFEKLASPRECQAVFKRTCYEGTRVVADYMREQIKALKVTRQTQANKNEKRFCTQYEKDILLKGMGVAPIRYVGESVDSKVGFDGYYENKKGTRVYPIPLLANSINRGTYFMTAQHFIDRTKRGGQSKAIDAMSDALDAEIKKRTH